MIPPLHLTKQERGMLRNLIIKEARVIGYGTKYHELNRNQWPARLNHLRCAAGKLMNNEDG